MTPNEKLILSGLNESQRTAVTAKDGPLLIVAGPGTGKTLTIVRRIAWLIGKGTRPEEILAVTFTNRAARELRERAEALLGGVAGRIFIGTLHLFGLRMLREAFETDFTVYNREEQTELLKSVLSCSAKKAERAAERISRFKNSLEDGDEETRAQARSYQSALKWNNAVDFDDLILMPIDILKNNPSSAFRDSLAHILVDEYQDINPPQHALLRLLARNGAALCAIGDSDQAIYGFRGADTGAFLRFGDDFKNAASVTLMRNYRSTETMVSASNSVIGNNGLRIAKEVVAAREGGAPVNVISVADERAEAEWIVREIEARIGGTSHDQMRKAGSPRTSSAEPFIFSDFAVIFRTNAQAKAIEGAFIGSGIPYQVIGRKSSLQSRQFEETVAYLRSLAWPAVAADQEGGNEAKLFTPADYFDPRANAVTLTTMHTAKGLEFRVVFIAGCEDGLIPSARGNAGVDVEEERRLFYVGMTRAKDELLLLHARSRFLYGERLTPSPSPFLGEIPGELTERRVVPDKVKRPKEPDRQMGLF